MDTLKLCKFQIVLDMNAPSYTEDEWNHAVVAIKEFLSLPANTNKDTLLACYLKVDSTYEV